MGDLFVLVLMMLGLWAGVCLAGYAMLALPMVLWYVGVGLVYALGYLAVGVHTALQWLLLPVRSGWHSLQHRLAYRRAWKATQQRQRHQHERVQGIFDRAQAAMVTAARR